MEAHGTWKKWYGQRGDKVATLSGSPPSTLWVPGTKLMSSGLCKLSHLPGPQRRYQGF